MVHMLGIQLHLVNTKTSQRGLIKNRSIPPFGFTREGLKLGIRQGNNTVGTNGSKHN